MQQHSSCVKLNCKKTKENTTKKLIFFKWWPVLRNKNKQKWNELKQSMEWNFKHWKTASGIGILLKKKKQKIKLKN